MSKTDSVNRIDGKNKEQCKHPKKFVKKNGIRKSKYGDVQIYYCKKCGSKFGKTTKTKYWKKKFPPEIIRRSIQIVKKGKSLRKAAEQIRLEFGIVLTHKTVRDWVYTYAPNFKMPRSRPIGKETRTRISIALKGRKYT